MAIIFDVRLTTVFEGAEEERGEGRERKESRTQFNNIPDANWDHISFLSTPIK